MKSTKNAVEQPVPDDGDEKTYLLGTVRIHIKQEDNPESPRGWSNAWKWYSNHRRYAFDKENGKYLSIDDIFDGETEEGESINDAILRQNPEFLDVRPIYLADHSSISISLGSFNDPWDSGVGAYAVITREQAEADAPDLKGDDDKLIEAAYGWLEGEVESYQNYLDGDVYGYVVEDGSGDQTDSCWGYYSIDDCIADAVACVSVKDATMVELGSLDLVNRLNEANPGNRFHQVAWVDEINDGERLFCAGVILRSYDGSTPDQHTLGDKWGGFHVLSAKDVARMLGYQQGEFKLHSVRLWNETEPEPDAKSEETT